MIKDRERRQREERGRPKTREGEEGKRMEGVGGKMTREAALVCSVADPPSLPPVTTPPSCWCVRGKQCRVLPGGKAPPLLPCTCNLPEGDNLRPFPLHLISNMKCILKIYTSNE